MVLVKKKCVDGCSPFNFICFTNTYIQAWKYLVPILEPLTKNKYTEKDLFNFATEIVEQDSSNIMGSLDIDSLFTNIPLEKTTEICTNNLFKNNNLAWQKVNLIILYLQQPDIRILYLIIYYTNKLSE